MVFFIFKQKPKKTIEKQMNSDEKQRKPLKKMKTNETLQKPSKNKKKQKKQWFQKRSGGDGHLSKIHWF